MKKKILVLTLMVALVTVSVFASNQQRRLKQDGTQQEGNGSPLYVQMGENNYKNMETNQIVSKEGLPDNCVLGEGSPKRDYRNISESRDNGNRSHMKLNSDFQRGMNKKTSNNSRNSGREKSYMNDSNRGYSNR